MLVGIVSSDRTGELCLWLIADGKWHHGSPNWSTRSYLQAHSTEAMTWFKSLKIDGAVALSFAIVAAEKSGRPLDPNEPVEHIEVMSNLGHYREAR